MSKAFAYDWVHVIDQALLDLDEKPQFGSVRPFPWQNLEKELSTLFEQKGLTIEHKEIGWQQGQQCFEGLAADLVIQSVAFAPLQTELFFVTSGQDLRDLFIALLKADQAMAPFIDEALLEGFTQYLGLAVLEKMTSLPFNPSLTLRLGNVVQKSELEQIPAYGIDISLHLGEKRFWGRILIPEGFRAKWKEHIQGEEPTLATLAQTDEGQKITFDVALECGAVELALSEWKKAKENDFIVLDRCSYDPKTKKGRLVLTLGSRPIFRGKITPDGLKLFEYPFYKEVDDTMDESFDEDEEEDVYDDLDDEEEEFDEEFEEEEDEEEGEEDKIEQPSLGKSVKKEVVEEEKTSLSADEIPICLTVEVGKIKMSAKELLALSPGNLLQLNITPEQGVNLVVGGKRVGRGELIRIGEVLGVRIVQL